MFRLLHQKKSGFKKIYTRAQILSTYAATIFIIVSVFVAMTIFLRRALQGRIEDARRYAMTQVRNFYETSYYAGENTIPGPIRGSYEPYYIERGADVAQDVNQTEDYRSWNRRAATFVHTYEDTTVVSSGQHTKPPACAE